MQIVWCFVSTDTGFILLRETWKSGELFWQKNLWEKSVIYPKTGKTFSCSRKIVQSVFKIYVSQQSLLFSMSHHWFLLWKKNINSGKLLRENSWNFFCEDEYEPCDRNLVKLKFLFFYNNNYLFPFKNYLIVIFAMSINLYFSCITIIIIIIGKMMFYCSFFLLLGYKDRMYTLSVCCICLSTSPWYLSPA